MFGLSDGCFIDNIFHLVEIKFQDNRFLPFKERKWMEGWMSRKRGEIETKLEVAERARIFLWNKKVP